MILEIGHEGSFINEELTVLANGSKIERSSATHKCLLDRAAAESLYTESQSGSETSCLTHKINIVCITLIVCLDITPVCY